MKQVTKSAIYALVLGLGINCYAQSEPANVSYFDGKNTQTMNVQETQFAPTHPASCAEKKPVPVAETPRVVAKAEGDSDGDGVVDSLDKCPDTPHGYKVDPNGCPVSVTLHINFAFDSTIIPASSNDDVTKLAKILKDNPPATVTIIGHTDSVGTDAYNQKLSERRAQSLGKRLNENGIDSTRIKTFGKGEKEPIATNSTVAGRAQNRRIEVKLY
ncbi:OmpA family protein [Sulfuricurvum sp.]|uniref:OmpA family protein n=1 Tax=Sulfuricurvum sp. TaxID=2025608 RepID=UPI002638D1D2|nr:OmpA family protein [Sulfuricurvum sp.]MDD2267401.1 OmpA family protein [Sulfuricurvum sp.]MDD2783080.1 OmpA family protein [Sulfuricurvum sp.]